MKITKIDCPNCGKLEVKNLRYNQCPICGAAVDVENKKPETIGKPLKHRSGEETWQQARERSVNRPTWREARNRSISRHWGH